MYAVDQDFDGHPLRGAGPVLQRFACLSAGLMAATTAAEAAQACTPELLAYLSETCVNTTHALAVQQQLERVKAEGEVVEAVQKAAQTVQARALAFRTTANECLVQYTAQRTDVLAKLAAAGSTTTTSSAALERHLIGVPGAALSGLPTTTATRAGTGEAANPNLSCVWRLTGGAPANKTDCLALAPVTPTAALPPSPRRPAEAPAYALHALSSATAVVAPYLVRLQCLALIGAGAGEALELVAACAGHLSADLGRTDGRRPFGMLEVLRHAMIVALAQNAATVGRLTPRVPAELNGAVAYVAQLDEDIKEARKMQQFPAALIALREAAVRLLREYALFFHLVATLTAPLGPGNEPLAAVASALDPRNGALTGVFRFPCLAPLLLSSANGRAQRRPVRDPTSGESVAMVVTATDAWRLGANKEAVMGTLAPFSTSLAAAVTNAVMPAASFVTLAVLSSLATMPMADVVSVYVGVPEMAAMAESSTAVQTLLRQLQRAAWGDVYACACEAARCHLAEASVLPSATVRAVLSEVRDAVCFQYLRVRSFVCLEQAAAALRLPGGVREMALVTERLVQDGKLAARINGVAGTVRHVVRPTRTDPKRVLVEALIASDASAHETELQLRTLSAQRSFGSPSLQSTDPHFWRSEGATRY